MAGPVTLTKEHLALVNGSLRRLHDLQTTLDKCKNCSMDVSSVEEDRRFLVDQLENIKKEFFARESK